jgi:murein tripeptide amidase MpaA
MLLLFLSLFGLALAEDYPAGRIRYDGQQVLKCKFDAAPMQQILDHLDVWGVLPEGEIDIRVKTPEERAMVESLLEGCKVLIEDLEPVIQKSDEENAAARAQAGNAPDRWFESYHTYAELNQYYRDLVNTYSWITVQTLGQTANGNNIQVYTMNPNRLTSGPIIFLDAGIHAREWIAPATLNYVVDNLITQYNSNNANVRNLMNRARIVFNPLINIDGYLYTWSTDRMWRKNRSRYNGSTCYGTDCNRNFNSHWGQGGSSTNPCSDTYMGPSIASEREVSLTQDYIFGLQSSGQIYAYMSYHSYSQLILRPWGWTSANSPNETYLAQLGNTMQTQIQAIHGRTYRSQKSNALYVTTGTSDDWYYDDGVTNGNKNGTVTYRVASYTIELRPQENNSAVGFQLPPAEIIPTGNENYTPLINFFNSVLTSPVIKTN